MEYAIKFKLSNWYSDENEIKYQEFFNSTIRTKLLNDTTLLAIFYCLVGLDDCSIARPRFTRTIFILPRWILQKIEYLFCASTSRTVQLLARIENKRIYLQSAQNTRSSVPSDLEDLRSSGTFTSALAPTLSLGHMCIVHKPCSMNTDKERVFEFLWVEILLVLVPEQLVITTRFAYFLVFARRLNEFYL